MEVARRLSSRLKCPDPNRHLEGSIMFLCLPLFVLFSLEAEHYASTWLYHVAYIKVLMHANETEPKRRKAKERKLKAIKINSLDFVLRLVNLPLDFIQPRLLRKTV